MDLIAKAQEQRAWHLAQVAKLDVFIEMGRQLAASSVTANPTVGTPEVHSPLPPAEVKNAPSRPKTGVGADTLNAAEELVRQLGPMTTRELLPFVLERGIEVGGKDPVATLSARISSKGDLVVIGGKWQFQSDLDRGQAGLDKEEAVDIPSKETPTASLFHTNQGTL